LPRVIQTGLMLHSDRQSQRVLVWDVPTRAFHWLLVIGLAASWITGEKEWYETHYQIGLCVGWLIIFRILWGFVGPKHARFSSFLKGPTGIWKYARALGAGTMIETAGHNPLGGLSVILLLGLVAFQAGTGLFATDDIVWTGPYNGAVSSEWAQRLTAWHHVNFNFILAAVALHLLAIAFYFLVKKQNLVGAMLSGKRGYESQPADEVRFATWPRFVVAVVIAAAVAWIVTRD